MNEKKERFNDIGIITSSSITSVIGLILYVIGAIIAGWFSWSCNSTHGFGIIARIIFAILASLGSWSYLAIYAIYKWGTCK